MTYYVGTMPVGEHLSHHGIKGMKWGQRRYQNPDGSLTAAGRARYGNYMSRASRASGMAAANRRAAGQSRSRLMKSIYGVNERYYTSRANKLTAKANRVKRTKSASNSANRRKTLRKVGIAVGAGAAAAGAAYLGKRYGKSALKVAKGLRNKRIQPNALKNISKAQNAYSRFKSGASAFGSKAKNVGKRAAGATGDAFRGAGYHTRRAGAKAKNAARNVGYKAGNAPYFMKRTAQRAGGAVKNAAKKAPGAAKKYYKKTHGGAIGAAYNAGMGALYYGHARRGGASRGQAAAVGATRAATGRILPAHAVGIGVRAYNSAKKRKSTKKTTRRRTSR